MATYPNSSEFRSKFKRMNRDSAAGFDSNSNKSNLSPTLLSNYVLSITLLKNIAMKQAY